LILEILSFSYVSKIILKTKPSKDMGFNNFIITFWFDRCIIENSAH